jgi:hypothetical protein
LKVTPEVRPEVVELLASAGMSTRAIAAVTGVSRSTVSRDLSGVSFETPDDSDTEVCPAAAAAITGMDGKTYARPKPKPRPASRKSPRPSFPGEFGGGVQALFQPVLKVQKLVSDDRFANYAQTDERALGDRASLLAVIETLQRIVDAIPDDGFTDRNELVELHRDRPFWRPLQGTEKGE